VSWSVEGRIYHSYAEYEKARVAETGRRLRRSVERLQVPPAKTARLEASLAAAEVHNRAVRRLGDQIRQQAVERQAMAEAHRERIGAAFREVERDEGRLLADLDGMRRALVQRIEDVEEHRRAAVAAVSAQLDREVAADRQDEAAAHRRRGDLLARSAAILAGIAPERLRDAALDASPLRGLLERAHREAAAGGLDLARRAYDQAGGLESNLAYREARLEALREVFTAEVDDLLQALQFTPEDRADLVGEGAAAVDAPLRQELVRLRDSVRGIRQYEDHELRFADLGKVLDPLTARVSDLASQVRDFDRLEAHRVALVKDRLGEQLRQVLGDEVEIVEVVPGELGLQPVEARFRTARGEKVDCSVSIDGTLRIHHYEHVNEASCAASARTLAEHLPQLMAASHQPALDVAAAAAARLAASGETQTRTQTRTDTGGHR
jgi:hypothetical protein